MYFRGSEGFDVGNMDAVVVILQDNEGYGAGY